MELFFKRAFCTIKLCWKALPPSISLECHEALVLAVRFKCPKVHSIKTHLLIEKYVYFKFSMHLIILK